MKADKTFLTDVIEGLNAKPKRLPSKYFYDENGDKIFQHIMNQPEYYLTCAEHEILQTNRKNIFSHINTKDGIRIVEPGAGDGLKTKILIKELLSNNIHCIYNPIDISANVLDILCGSFQRIYPNLLCEPIVGDYAHIKGKIASDGLPKLMLFLGSNIGNYNAEEANKILTTFNKSLSRGDYFLLGADLIKDPEIVLNAYNDRAGYTALFNYNLLERINKELGADFNVEEFKHRPVYNSKYQQAESYLVSQKEQEVRIETMGIKFRFRQGEAIHTEISRKFTLEHISSMASKAGFKVVENYLDINNFFCCSLWKK